MFNNPLKKLLDPLGLQRLRHREDQDDGQMGKRRVSNSFLSVISPADGLRILESPASCARGYASGSGPDRVPFLFRAAGHLGD